MQIASLIVLTLATSTNLPAQDPPETPRAPLRVLFVGNSYVYFNNLPAVLTRLSRELVPIEAEMIIKGGATLESHLEDGRAEKSLRDGEWDFVVLQEQSTLGTGRARGDDVVIGDPSSFHESVRRFDRLIRQHGARTVLMATWARQHAPQTLEDLSLAYRAIGAELDAFVAPVGEVWRDIQSEENGLDLYTRDRSHPAPHGTLVAASVLLATIHGSLPKTLPTLEVPAVNVAGKITSESVTIEMDVSDFEIVRQAISRLVKEEPVPKKDSDDERPKVRRPGRVEQFLSPERRSIRPRPDASLRRW